MDFPPPTTKQARIIWTAVTGLALALIVALLVVLVWGLGRVLDVLAPVLWPLAIAGVIAYLLDPVVDALQRRGTPRVRAIVIVFAMAVLFIAGIFGSIVPQVVVETRQLVREIPTYANKVTQRVEGWIKHPPSSVLRSLGLPIGGTNVPPATVTSTNAPAATNAPPSTNTVADTEVPAATTNSTELAEVEPVETTPDAPAASGEAGTDVLARWLRDALDMDTLQSATGILAKALTKIGSWFFGQLTKVASWFGVLAGLALIPIYTFYFLLEKKGIESKWTDYLPVARSEFKTELVFVLKSINDYLIAFFRGQVLVAICDGIMYTIGFALIGLPYAVLIGVIATFLTIIPFVGAIITCGGALVIAVVQYGDWLHPLLALLVYAIVQMLEGYVIQPKILGDRVGLHPLTIIVAVMVGTTLLGGILGGILAIPFTAALRVIMFRYVWKTKDPNQARQTEAAPEPEPGGAG